MPEDPETTPVLQVPPNVAYWLPPTAMHANCVSHITELKVVVPVNVALLHPDEPLKVNPFPVTSTAAQKPIAGHDTDVSCVPESIVVGVMLQLVTYETTKAFPAESTAVQNEMVGHDIELIE